MIIRRYKKKLRKMFGQHGDQEIAPDEIFLDASNLPKYNTSQFEGRIEKPISKNTLLMLGGIFFIVFIVATFKVGTLQIIEGETYTIQSESNRLRHSLIFSERGVVYDRNNVELAWNISSDVDNFAHRKYIDKEGFGHILGYVSYPLKDSKGIYYQEAFVGISGVEQEFNWLLVGENGLKIIETDALGVVQSESIIRPPVFGSSIELSIDAQIQSKLYSLLKNTAKTSEFVGGAGVLMDVTTGEILALSSYPEYNPEILAEGEPSESIAAYISDDRKPFLNRAISGIYTPGSIVKPYLAIGALNEGIISPEVEILSTGSISIPNPFFPNQSSIFVDWKAHGYVNMKEAIGVSSNVYFYEIGGGFEDQQGLGIEGIELYVRMFGLGEKSGIDIPAEVEGVIPNPSWKETHFPGDIWRIGDTYNTAIGQYGFQITLIQAVRAMAALANKGTLLEPTIRYGGVPQVTRKIQIPEKYFDVVQEGMRYAVTNGTAQGLSFPHLQVAAKTGTAEVGANNQFINSWITGFFPYEKPRYAFAVIMERAPKGTLIGSVLVTRNLLEWMSEQTPEYMTTQSIQ